MIKIEAYKTPSGFQAFRVVRIENGVRRTLAKYVDRPDSQPSKAFRLAVTLTPWRFLV